MPRRRLILAAVAALFFAVGVGVWLAWPAATRITMENAGRIKEGMTLAQVEAILGGPARDEMQTDSWAGPLHLSAPVGSAMRTRTSAFWRITYSHPWLEAWHDPLTEWKSPACRALVIFDLAGRVVRVFADPVTSTTEYGLFFLKK